MFFYSTFVGSACAGLVLDAGGDEVRSSDACSVGGTRDSFSEKSCCHHLAHSSSLPNRLLAVDIVSHRNKIIVFSPALFSCLLFSYFALSVSPLHILFSVATCNLSNQGKESRNVLLGVQVDHRRNPASLSPFLFSPPFPYGNFGGPGISRFL